MFVKAKCKNSKGGRLTINVYGENAQSKEAIREFVAPYALISWVAVSGSEEEEFVFKVSPQLSNVLKSIDSGKLPVDALKEMDRKRKLARDHDYAEDMRDEHY